MTRNLLRTLPIVGPVAGLVMVAGCTVVPPSAPSVVALPNQGGNFAQFRAHDAGCRDFASAEIGYGASARAATQNSVGSAAVGTALGAAAGAALGSLGGRAGAGAAVGAVGGLLAGSAMGAGTARASAVGLQRRYDVAYMQCMVANGYTVQQPSYAVGYGWYPGYPGYPAYAYPAYPPPYPGGIGIEFGFGAGRWHGWR